MPAAVSGSNRSSPSMNDTALSPTNLYIRGLPPVWTDANLRELCEGFGDICSTKAIMDPNTNLCKGYGFVDFSNATDASKALEGLKAKGYQVQMAKLQEPDFTNLYIDNLPPTMTEQELKKMFQQTGVVVSTRILTNQKDQTSKCQGFARMQNKQQCDAAIEKFNKVELPGQLTAGGLLVKFADQSNRKKNHAQRQAQNPIINVFDPFAHVGKRMRLKHAEAYFKLLQQILTSLGMLPPMPVPAVQAIQLPVDQVNVPVSLNFALPLQSPALLSASPHHGMPPPPPPAWHAGAFYPWQAIQSPMIAATAPNNGPHHGVHYYQPAVTANKDYQQQLQQQLLQQQPQQPPQLPYMQAAAPSQLNEVPVLHGNAPVGNIHPIPFDPAGQYAYQSPCLQLQ